VASAQVDRRGRKKDPGAPNAQHAASARARAATYDGAVSSSNDTTATPTSSRRCPRGAGAWSRTTTGTNRGTSRAGCFAAFGPVRRPRCQRHQTNVFGLTPARDATSAIERPRSTSADNFTHCSRVCRFTPRTLGHHEHAGKPSREVHCWTVTPRRFTPPKGAQLVPDRRKWRGSAQGA
jgi:hypothetical protein